MEILFLWVGRLAGIGGVLLCAWAVFNRIGGSYFAAGFRSERCCKAG